MDPVEDAELARRVYARSWPQTCRQDYDADAIIERLGDRDVTWWQRTLDRSPICVAGGPAQGGFGFLVMAQEVDGWNVTYAFCEPEAFGTGLIDALSDNALARLALLDPTCGSVGAWILAGNVMSQSAAAKRGWHNRGLLTPPWAASAAFYRYELPL